MKIVAILLILILIAYIAYNVFNSKNQINNIINKNIIPLKTKQTTPTAQPIQKTSTDSNVSDQYNSSTNKPKINTVELEKQVHDLINKERTKNNQTILTWNEELSNIARKHSEDMANRGYFNHSSPEGYNFSYRYEENGFECSILINTTQTNNGYWQDFATGGENLFQNTLYNYVTYRNSVPNYNWNSQEKIAETTVQGWMNSTHGHRENLLTSYWKSEGIGVAVSSDDWIYITENFC